MWVNLRIIGWSRKSVHKKTEIHQVGQVSVRKHHAGRQEGQKTGETQSKPLVKLHLVDSADYVRLEAGTLRK